MSKFGIFTVFLSVTVMVVVAELLAGGLGDDTGLNKQLAANSVGMETQQVGSSEVYGKTEQTHGSATSYGQKLTFAMVDEAGFTDAVLQRVPFDGKIFGSLDVSDFNRGDALEYNLLENNRDIAAQIVEFDGKTEVDASQFYSLLKQKAGLQKGASMNETNQFGENSFYLNFPDKKTSVFLVVKGGKYVYALAYQKDLHPLVKMLLNLLFKIN